MDKTREVAIFAGYSNSCKNIQFSFSRAFIIVKNTPIKQGKHWTDCKTEINKLQLSKQIKELVTKIDIFTEKHVAALMIKPFSRKTRK